MTALRAFLPGGDDCAPHDERRLARCLVVDPCDGGRSSLLLQFAFNRALRGLRTLYVCASREGLAARPPVRPTRGGGAAAIPGTSTFAPPAAEHEALRRIAVKYVPHGEALRELLLALHLGEMEMPHTLIIDDLHELLPPAAAAGGGGAAAAAHHGAPSPARPSPSKPERQHGAMQAACTVALAAHAADYLSAAHAGAGGPPVALLVGAAAPLGAELPMLSRWLPAQLAVAADPQRAGVFALTGAHATDPWPAGADGAPPAAHYSLADRRLREVAPPALAAWG